MLVLRRWIFPILMVLVFGAIAVSLTKLAFFGDTSQGVVSPHAAVSDPVVAVERGIVQYDLELTGSIARDETVVVRSPVDGEIVEVHIGSNQDVAEGQVLFMVKRSDNDRRVEVTAPEAGRLGEIELVAGQALMVGGEAAKLSPACFRVLATVQPVQLYRLIGAPSSGTLTISGGPAPFDCAGITTQVAEDGTTSVRCSVPKEQTVFPGLPATLAISVGTAEDVLFVPMSAVKGGAGSGLVWVDAGDGSEPEERKVTLGVSDGTNVEVKEGLEEGEMIRQFVPGFMAPVEEFCYEIAPGEELCETGTSW